MRTQKGFALFEFIIYFAVAITISTAMVTAGINTIMEKNRLTELETVERSARLAMETMTREIRGAQSIASPQTNATSTILMLNAVNGTTSIAFSLNNGYIELQKETLSRARITDTVTAITALEFRNMSYLNAVKAVRISFTINAGKTQKEFITTQNIYAR